MFDCPCFTSSGGFGAPDSAHLSGDMDAGAGDSNVGSGHGSGDLSCYVPEESWD